MRVIKQLTSLSRLACYHGLRGKSNRDATGGYSYDFEIDLLLLLPPQNIILAEVKSYRGTLSRHNETLWLQVTTYKGQDEVKLVSNPFAQIRKTRQRFLKCLGGAFKDIPVNYCVIFTNSPEFSPALQQDIRQEEGVKFIEGEELFCEGVANYLTHNSDCEFSEKALLFMAMLSNQNIAPVIFDRESIFRSGGDGHGVSGIARAGIKP
jgi:hypothetical protein